MKKSESINSTASFHLWPSEAIDVSGLDAKNIIFSKRRLPVQKSKYIVLEIFRSSTTQIKLTVSLMEVPIE